MDPPWELVMTQRVWDATLRSLLLQPAHIAVGRLTVQGTRRRRNLLVGNLSVFFQARFPAGHVGRSQVILALPGPDDPVQPAAWLARLGVEPGSLTVILLLGLGKDRQGWVGAVQEGNVLRPLDGVRVLGPGMLHLFRAATAPSEDSPDWAAERWSRTRGALGQETWRKLRRQRIGILGVGRNGSALAFQLAALGISELFLCDFDTLEWHALDAFHMATEADVGKPKVEVLARRLLEFRSDMLVQYVQGRATDRPVIEALREVDLLITSPDSGCARLLAAHLCQTGILHLDVGTSIQTTANGERILAGDVRILNFREGCLQCVGGVADEEEARYELLAPPDALRRGPPTVWSEQRLGSLVTLNAMTVSSSIQLYLDLLGGELQGSCWLRLRWREGEGLEVNQGRVGATSGCRVCRGGDVD